ncbi:MAG: hypothetical protein RDO_0470 [Flavobacteriales endosymbiont of Rhyzopertha dominica]|nr:MAG: methionine--tRNA ligase [Candidatus Shikimatogenerans bostrichidophilus]
MKLKYIVTAALPYANNNIHIGHLSGVYIPSDIFIRNLKINNIKYIFISGTDEYGSNILIESYKKNINVKNIVDNNYKIIKNTLKKFNILLDVFYRTSNKIHHKVTKKIFNKLLRKNILYKKKNYQLYDKKYNFFLADRYIIGICPYCKYKYAYLDLCEKCGNFIKEGELLNKISILSKKKPIYKKTINYYINFKITNKIIKKYILLLIKNKNKKIVINSIKFFLKNNISNRCITRDLKWGIKLPNIKNKVIYVWFEALIAYISSIIYYSKKKKKVYKKIIYNKKIKFISFIGKDNIIFHSILLPVIYKSYNKKLIIPSNISANYFLNINNNKISKSNKYNIKIKYFLKYFPNMEDSLRFTLIMDMPERKDTNFTWKKFKLYNNSILIGVIGNLFKRIITLLNINCNNKIPIYKKKYINNLDKKILNILKLNFKKINEYIINYKFKKSLLIYIKLAKIGNKYLSINKPWELNDKNKINNILYISLKILEIIIKLSYIFLPNTYKKFLKIFNIKKKKVKINDKIIFSNNKINYNKNYIFFKKIYNDKFKKILNKFNNNDKNYK